MMLVWISPRIVIAAVPTVAGNLQITTNYGPAVNARGYDPLMAEQLDAPDAQGQNSQNASSLPTISP